MDSPRAVSVFWTKEINEEKRFTSLEDSVGRPGSRRRGPGEVGRVESGGIGGKGKSVLRLKQVSCHASRL